VCSVFRWFFSLLFLSGAHAATRGRYIESACSTSTMSGTTVPWLLEAFHWIHYTPCVHAGWRTNQHADGSPYISQRFGHIVIKTDFNRALQTHLNSINATPNELCVARFISNRHRIRETHFALEERGDTKIRYLSPRLHSEAATVGRRGGFFLQRWCVTGGYAPDESNNTGSWTGNRR
jgi:hypothetical protein